MRRGLLLSACLLCAAVPGLMQVQGQNLGGASWIWFNEGDPTRSAPAGPRWFRRTFDIDPKAERSDGTLEITADNTFRAWINNVEIGQGDDWRQIYRFDVSKHLRPGKNVLAIEASNESEGPAGLLVQLTFTPRGQARQTLTGDNKWKAAQQVTPGWQKLDFDDSKWPAVKVLGRYGQTGPWQNLAQAGKPTPRRFTVPEGFRVEQIVARPLDRGPFSLVNMTFDARGRLFLSQEGGPILLCVDPDKNGVFQKVVDYCSQVKNCQGMCWVGDALYLVGNGPNGTGLYRCRDTQGKDKIDEVQLVHRFKGGMGEHGPHAIVHGPDNHLYLVIGNHAWAQVEKLSPSSPLTRWPKGTEGPAPDRPGSTEDILLPYLNDANGHAANIRAPGGTIWRLDYAGQDMALVAAGFRNQFDAAFNPLGELFSYDSDMEWDENLPWYRAVKVCHCPPGADFMWRTGSAKTPDYYLDRLPPLLETGRGSPVGVEVYDHPAFPKQYRGALLLADWSIGVIYAVHLSRDGATYKGKLERFCTGSPLNVTDLEVGPDGAVYFTTGGRGSQGGVYRIVYTGEKGKARHPCEVQPLSAWGRAAIDRALAAEIKETGKDRLLADLKKKVADPKLDSDTRLRLLGMMQRHDLKPDLTLLATLVRDKNPEIRAQAIWLIGVNGFKTGKDALVRALRDEDALVRRRACEALIRAGIEPPVEAIGPLLAEEDRYVRTAARLVLQRIDPKKWLERAFESENQRLGREAIVALCKTGQAEKFAGLVFDKLHANTPREDPLEVLEYLRTLQLALCHTTTRPGSIRGIALDLLEMFPHKDWRVNRELAILLVYCRRGGKILDEPVQEKILKEMLQSKADPAQQIHYYYCLRLLHEGWTASQRNAILEWYESTKSWKGGHSFTPYLENILKDYAPIFTAEDRARVLSKIESMPHTARVLLSIWASKDLPSVEMLSRACEKVLEAKSLPRGEQLRATLINAIGRKGTKEAHDYLRKLADARPAVRDDVALALTGFPTAENYPHLLRGLESRNQQVLFSVIQALRSVKIKPKPDDPAPFRALLLASTRLSPGNRWHAVELLRHWTDGKSFGADRGKWQEELASWGRWFAQTFPKEPKLPNVAAETVVESKYKFDELLSFLQKEGAKGDPKKGKVVFEKAQCIKCHKYGNEGEGLGPDLTTLSKRFKRVDTLEAIYYPSKVISDQYRSTTFVTKKGQQIVGLAAIQGDTITVLQNDGTKVALQRSQIEQQYASLTSVMPANLLDPLTKAEIADLFAFLESEPTKP